MSWDENPIAEAPDEKVLRSMRFARDADLAAVANGRLRLGANGTAPHPAPVLSRGVAIAKVQTALIDLGYLARGGDDGKFGRDTGAAVVRFKNSRGIRPNDPVVGPLTITALDDALAPRDVKPQPPPKPRRNWFTGDRATGLSRVMTDSQVSFLVDAEDYYADLRAEVMTAAEQRRGGLVCWIGFEVSGDTPMPQGPAPSGLRPFARRQRQPDDRAWLDVLASAANQGVSVRALLNLHPAPTPANIYVDKNFSTVKKLNALPKAMAINDFRYLLINGTHHQKLVVVQSPAGLVAYIGTADIQPQRITDRWCEVQCKVRGEAARELYRVFYDRWIEHTATLAGQPPERSWIPRPSELSVAPSGATDVQVSTTYGDPRRPNAINIVGPTKQVVNAPHRVVIPPLPVPTPIGIVWSPTIVVANDFFKPRDPAAKPLIDMAGRQRPDYSFAPNGHTGIYHQIRAALEQRPQRIYMEDQYLVADEPMGGLASMLSLLETRVRAPDFQKLIILCTRIEEIDEEMKGLAAAHRRRFIGQLAAAGGDKVVICQYKSNAALGSGIQPPDKSPFYVHSKSWIFDDELAIIGSANCNRRGYSHDSELDIGVYDARSSLVRDLRARIWLRRLNTESVRTPLTPADVADFNAAAKFWERPAEFGLPIENHRIGIDKFVRSKTAFSIPEAYAPLLAAIARANPNVSTKDRLMWDLIVDPEGTCGSCAAPSTSREAREAILVGSV
ncbi:phosphatidylserine/phosphatidylglycerophosphate/cardiolipin synthase [Mycobacterium sp. JS623]|uniref:peptidoglycan-binding protein n=1 Tax=Mycobacterium sp. JS623 TaxID=212767 RepID=UPI0002A56631|nr:phospholipase D-like domain-containing protein [Mycobacterium sp. JS623]AGB24072.1 phosphatidylserine/phosphatidylglycerophosphate/cardiolipin synthase [Mycobacterium sp. JS623]